MTKDHRSTGRSLPIALLRAREAVMGPIRQMLSQTGMNEQKWRVMRVLDEGGPMEPTALAQQACLLLPSLTRILSVLESEGYIQRVPDDHDRRKSIVSVTAQGRDFLDMHVDQGNAILRGFEEQLGADRMNELLTLLDELQRLPSVADASQRK
jgi:homoprotocatechuate degradation regulator HpaR